MRSMILARRGEVAGAVEEVRRATEDAPQSADLLAEAAELLVHWTGNAEQSIALARRAREIEPHHPAATRFLAEIAAARALGPEHSESARDEAIVLYGELAQSDDAERHEALQTLVQLKLQAGDMAGALESVRQLVRERPGDVRATQTLAQLLLHSDRKNEALEVLLDYVVGHPQEEEVLGWAEQLAGSQQAWPAVVDFLSARQPFKDGSGLVKRFLGEALLRLERVTEAAPLLEQALAERPDDARLRKDVALAYRGLGRMADAAALFEELARESPEYPFLQQLLAETLAEQRDIDGALQAYTAALQALDERSDVDPVHRDAIRQRIALLHLGRKDYALVRETLAGLESDPGALALEIRCRMALDTGEWDEARRLARELEETNRGRALMLEGESFAF